MPLSHIPLYFSGFARERMREKGRESEDVLGGIGSHNNGSKKASQSAVCKLVPRKLVV